MRKLIAAALLTCLIASTGLAQESGSGKSAEDVARELANPNTDLPPKNGSRLYARIRINDPIIIE